MHAPHDLSLDELARHIGGPCVSILVPIDRRHADDQRDHVQLKDLVASARSQLESAEASRIDDLLDGPEAVLRRPIIANQPGGLALFCAPGLYIELPTDWTVGPAAVVASCFAVASLLPPSRPAPCHVLVVGGKRVSLHRVDGSTWTPCAVADLPASIEDALGYERLERMSGAHAGGPAHAGSLSIIGHGRGAQDEDRKQRLTRYFHQVDAAVVAHLHLDPDAPLVAAGTGPAVSRYQSVTRHRHVVPAVVGSPDELSPPELRRQVEAVIQLAHSTSEDDLLARVGELLGTGRASIDLAELVHTAPTGQVAELLVGSTTPRWGRVGDHVEFVDQWAVDADDLLDRVICEAWRAGATVRAIGPGRLPNDAVLAALYRY